MASGSGNTAGGVEQAIRQIVREEIARSGGFPCDHLMGVRAAYAGEGAGSMDVAYCVKCGSTGPFTQPRGAA